MGAVCVEWRGMLPSEVTVEDPPADDVTLSVRSSARAWATALALVLLAIWVRVVCRPGRPMWFDEGYSIALARSSLRTFWGTLRTVEANGSLYYVLLRGLQRAADLLGGTDDLALARGLAAALGAATVPLLFVLGARLFDRTTGAIAASLLAVGQFHAYFSLEARTYTLAAFLATASSYLLVRALDAPGSRRFALYAAAMALGAYAHFFNAFVFAAHCASAPLHPSMRAGADASTRRRARRGLLLSAVAVTFAALPLFHFVRRHDVGQISWIPVPGWAAVAQFFLLLSGHVRLDGPFALPGDALRTVEVALVTVAVVAGAVAYARRDAGRGFGYAVALAWFAAPVALALLASLRKPLFLHRYLMVAVPAWTLLVAAGLRAFRRQWVILPAAAVVVALSLSGTLRPERGDPPASYQSDDLARHVLSRARRGDALVFSLSAHLVPFEYHWRALGFPPDVADVIEPAPHDPLGSERDHWADRRPLAERIADRQRVWFVLAGEQGEAHAAREAFAREAVLLEEKTFDWGYTVMLYERRETAPTVKASR
jgi:mannosyltransferase